MRGTPAPPGLPDPPRTWSGARSADDGRGRPRPRRHQPRGTYLHRPGGPPQGRILDPMGLRADQGLLEFGRGLGHMTVGTGDHVLIIAHGGGLSITCAIVRIEHLPACLGRGAGHGSKDPPSASARPQLGLRREAGRPLEVEPPLGRRRVEHRARAGDRTSALDGVMRCERAVTGRQPAKIGRDVDRPRFGY